MTAFVADGLRAQSFHDPGWSARAEGMGGLFSSEGHDSTAIYYNPSGITSLKKNEIVLMNYTPYAGIEGLDWNYYLFAGSFRLRYFSLGLGYTNYGVKNTEGSNVYSANTYTVSVARRMRSFSLGLNGRILEHRYLIPPELSGDFPASSRASFTADAGILYEFGRELSIGISGFNLLPADVGLRYEDIVPRTARLNASYRFYTERQGPAGRKIYLNAGLLYNEDQLLEHYLGAAGA
ncbi:MAG TPA: hypothetical protein VJC03_08680, partial [bacterium]|nr:hypothetical protein [bacterium]